VKHGVCDIAGSKDRSGRHPALIEYFRHIFEDHWIVWIFRWRSKQDGSSSRAKKIARLHILIPPGTIRRSAEKLAQTITHTIKSRFRPSIGIGGHTSRNEKKRNEKTAAPEKGHKLRIYLLPSTARCFRLRSAGLSSYLLRRLMDIQL
jgi:hypothetical protein